MRPEFERQRHLGRFMPHLAGGSAYFLMWWGMTVVRRRRLAWIGLLVLSRGAVAFLQKIEVSPRRERCF